MRPQFRLIPGMHRSSEIIVRLSPSAKGARHTDADITGVHFLRLLHGAELVLSVFADTCYLSPHGVSS